MGWEVGRWWGGVGGGKTPTKALCGVAITLTIGQEKPIYSLKDISLLLMSILGSYILFSAVYEVHCLSCEFTGLGRFALEK